MIPRSVADNYAQSSMQQPQYQLTTSDIAYHNGSYVWSYSIVPEPLVVKLTGQQYGAMYVDMTTTEKRIQKEESRFVNGRGLALFDSYRYQSVLESPGKEHRWQTTFNAQSNGQPYMAHSTITYDWHFRPFPIPQVFATPRMGSVELMYPNGSTESLSPAQARNTSLLEGQNYYPYHLSNYKVESMQFRQGIINKFFVGDEVLAIADLPEGGNQWPLAVPTEANSPELTYFTATEPTGAGNGVYEIWTTDAQTGEMGVQQYNDSQIGPQRAVDFIERTPQVNRLSNAQAVSPVPIVQGESLYWHAKVIPGSESGVVYTAFVNAASGEGTLLEGTQPIYAFLTQGQVQEVQRQAQQTNQNTMTVRIAVTNQAGEIQGMRNITVPEGGNVKITAENPAGNASSTRASGPA